MSAFRYCSLSGILNDSCRYSQNPQKCEVYLFSYFTKQTVLFGWGHCIIQRCIHLLLNPLYPIFLNSTLFNKIHIFAESQIVSTCTLLVFEDRAAVPTDNNRGSLYFDKSIPSGVSATYSLFVRPKHGQHSDSSPPLISGPFGHSTRGRTRRTCWPEPQQHHCCSQWPGSLSLRLPGSHCVVWMNGQVQAF